MTPACAAVDGGTAPTTPGPRCPQARVSDALPVPGTEAAGTEGGDALQLLLALRLGDDLDLGLEKVRER